MEAAGDRDGAGNMPMIFGGGNFTVTVRRAARYRFTVADWRLGDPRLSVRHLS